MKQSSDERFRKDWWWRRIKTRHLVFDDRKHTLKAKSRRGKLWKEVIEPLAHAYELARRGARDANLPAYPKARRLARLLKDFSRPESFRIYRKRDVPLESDLSFWDDDNWGPLGVDWHYTASIEAAVVAFKQLFLAERKKRGIHRVPRGQEGRRNRSVSWRGIELLDIKYSKDKTHFPASERALVSKARAAAEKFYNILHQQLTILSA
jgi:hypothetical protein